MTKLNADRRLVSRTESPRALARMAGAKTYFTGISCKRGHVARRATVNGVCVECLPAIAARTRKNNRAAVRARHAKWMAANPDKMAALKRREYEKNKERYRASAATYRKVHREESAVYAREWRARNRGKKNAASAGRRSNMRSASLWGKEGVETIYILCDLIRQATGEEWHVDHRIPLKGKNVCGLHVPSNLQIMPKLSNLRKKNTLVECPTQPTEKGEPLHYRIVAGRVYRNGELIHAA